MKNVVNFIVEGEKSSEECTSTLLALMCIDMDYFSLLCKEMVDKYKETDNNK